MHSFLNRLLLGVGLIAGPMNLGAAETPAKPGPPPAEPPVAAVKATPPATASPAAPVTGPEVFELPKIEITATRLKELDRAIKKLDKAIAREKKNMKASELDKVLNNAKLAEAAAIFGGNSSAYLESVAATRVRYMEAERGLLSDMKEPRSLDDMAILQKELDQIHTMQRELDSTKH